MNRRSFLVSTATLALQSGISHATTLLQSGRPVPDPDLMQKLMRDPLRPQYHLLPQAGFVGDPCAPRFFRGEYHVFFHGSFDGPGWHHAKSSDLVHWNHLPIALSPTPDGYDSYGTFTGGMLPGGDGASVVFTGVTKVPRFEETIRAEGLREVQCIATATDNDIRVLKKRDKPIIDAPPPGLRITGFRDPFSWKEGDTWYLGVGSGFPQVGGAVLLYRSKDTQTWEYLHPLAQGVWNGKSFSNPVPNGEMWECPDFFPLGNKHVLIYSTEYTTRWEVGTFDRRQLRFHSEKKGILDDGAYYAPRSMSDGSGRRILWGWIQETRPSAAVKETGWSGCISLPRVLTLGTSNELQMGVAPELAILRRNTATVNGGTNLNDFLPRAVIHKRAGEILCTFKTGEGVCGLELQLKTSVSTTSLIKIDYAQTNGRPFVAIGDKLLPVSPDEEGFSTLHLWVDGSVIETFIDNKRVITTRCYPNAIGAGEVLVKWNGSQNLLKRMSISDIESISHDRMAT